MLSTYTSPNFFAFVGIERRVASAISGAATSEEARLALVEYLQNARDEAGIVERDAINSHLEDFGEHTRPPGHIDARSISQEIESGLGRQAASGRKQCIPAATIEHDLDDLVEARAAKILNLIIGEWPSGLSRVAQNLVEHVLHATNVICGIIGLCAER